MSILSKALNTIGSWTNDLTGVTSSREAQNEYTTQMWNATNEYNSPTAQLARMREAGIDINPTAYALGANNLSNTASHVTSGSGSPAGNPVNGMIGMISGAMGIASGLANLKYLDEQTMNANIQGENLITQGEGIALHNESVRLNNEIAQHNLNYGKKIGKPVGYVPTATADPINYAGELLGDAVTSVGNTIAGW